MPLPPPPATTRYSTEYEEAVVIEFDADEAWDVPFEPVAVTVKVYEVFAFNPETIIGLEEPEAVIFPGDEVTVYDETVTFVGAVNDTVADQNPNSVADTLVGEFGTAAI